MQERSTLTTLKLREDLEVIELDGEAVVYDEESATVHHLNSSALLILNLLKEELPLNEVVSHLVCATGESHSVIEEQVTELTRSLRAAGLLK